MIDINTLCDFLIEAKKSTYAAWDWVSQIKEKDHSTTLIYVKWNLKYNDNYFGWEPFGGREVVFLDDKPVYMMTYYGRVYDNIVDFKGVYWVLQDALRLIPKDAPYRWPCSFISWNYEYLNNFNWKIDNFFGEEIIKLNWQIVYKTKYIWWFVDQR